MGALSVIRRFVWWPVFAALAVLHLVLLPLVLTEHDDDVLSLVAGAGYLVLAVLDVLVRRRDVASARGRRRSIDGPSWEEPAGDPIGPELRSPGAGQGPLHRRR